MIIERRDTKLFKDLFNGMTFSYSDEFFIKIPMVCLKDKYCINAINLENGENNYFTDDEKVTPLKAKVVIE